MRGALVAYAVALVVLVAGPWGHALNRLTVRLYVLFRYDWPIAPSWALPEHYGLILNVVLFVPLGAVLALVTGWRWWQVCLAAVLASTLLELLQLVLPRDSDPYDVLTNGIGAALGALVITAFVRRPSRPGR